MVVINVDGTAINTSNRWIIQAREQPQDFRKLHITAGEFSPTVVRSAPGGYVWSAGAPLLLETFLPCGRAFGAKPTPKADACPSLSAFVASKDLHAASADPTTSGHTSCSTVGQMSGRNS